MSLQALMNDATQRLQLAGVQTARLDAEVLLAHCQGLPRLDMLMQRDASASPQVAHLFAALIARRAAHEPVAYITGQCEFWSLDLKITPDVLIPRPDSELLVATALDHLDAAASGTFVDLGTGSGCLSLAVLSERPGCRAIGLDVSQKALDVAQTNAKTLGLRDRLELRCQSMIDWLKGEERVDLILSNPPYITLEAYDGLPQDVRLYEPKGALLGGSDGLDFYRAIASNARGRLTQGGAVAVEIGYDQGAAVSALFQPYFKKVECLPDLAGHDRVVVARGSG